MSDTAPYVLVVDDNFDDLQIILTALDYYGFKAEAAGSASECWQMIQRRQPELIVTDLAMPEGDGWAVLDMVHASPAYSHIPVIAITAYHSPKLADEVLNSGFAGYFPKPIDMGEFAAHLWRIARG